MPINIDSENRTAVKAVANTPINFAGLLRGNTVSRKDRMLFTEQLALLLETGESLLSALEALKRQTSNSAFLKVINALIIDINEGKSFSAALSKHQKVFSKTYTNLIAASESGGFMYEVLKRLLQMEERREKLSNALVSAFTYPVFLLLFSVLVVIFVLTSVFPKFENLFSSIRDQLPLSTVVLMWSSDILRLYWHYLLAAVGVAAYLTYYWVNSPIGKAHLDRLKLSIWFVKDIFIRVYLVQVLQSMSLSISNGVGIMDTLQGCRTVVQNSLFQKFIFDVENSVQEGNGIATGFQRSSLIPVIVKQMVTTGDNTGNLARVTSRLAEYYERDLSRRLATFSRLVEPVMLLVMGVVVGILVSSLILPIFKLSRVVH